MISDSRTWISVTVATQFADDAERRNVSNGRGRVYVHAITSDLLRAIVVYERYNGTGSLLELWTSVIEEVPTSELWEVIAP